MVASLPGASYPSYAANPALATMPPTGAAPPAPMFGDSVHFGKTDTAEAPTKNGYGTRLKWELKDALGGACACCCLGIFKLPFTIPLAFIRAIKSDK